MAQTDAVVLDLPLAGATLAKNSPARKVPSHGTHMLGQSYAIDLVPVDSTGKSARTTWRALFATEPPEAFIGFGRPALAPITGTVALVHDGEPDHVARRSLFTVIPYLFGQGKRLRAGFGAIGGNHVAIAVERGGPFVLLAHLKEGSIRVGVGDEVCAGDAIAKCGNSGNSTEPHVHLQVTDSLDWPTATGLPIAFRTYRRVHDSKLVHNGLPGESEIIEAVFDAEQ